MQPSRHLAMSFQRKSLSSIGFKISLATALIISSYSSMISAQSLWHSQLRGGNCFNETVTEEWFRAADSAGLQFIRLVPNKWKSNHRDFLLGNADDYRGLVPKDLNELRRILDMAYTHGMKVVLSTLSLPGARWRQHNGMVNDTRLWEDKKYWQQSKDFWKDIAQALKGHPAIAGYNVLNEPIPERSSEKRKSNERVSDWYRRVHGTAADLNDFYREIVPVIREVDSSIPIILDAGSFASPEAFEYLEPIDDSLVIYSVHFYEPWEFVNRKENNGKFHYPDGNASFSCVMNDDTVHGLNHALIECLLAPVDKWTTKHSIPSNRILVGEFGCNRLNPGVAQYFNDLIASFDERYWHWAFYSFREDTWDGMDYELGDRPPGWEYWKAKDRGENPELKRVENPIWQSISKNLHRGSLEIKK